MNDTNVLIVLQLNITLKYKREYKKYKSYL